MKNLFRICLLVSILLASKVSAQNSNPVEFGVKVGLNIPNVSSNAAGYDVKAGVNAGITVEYMIDNYMYVISGLEYSMKGGYSYDAPDLYLSYIHLPIHLGAKASIGGNAKMFLHFGPYLAYGIDGDIKSNGVSIDAFKSTRGITPLKRFDAGLGMALGFEINKVVLSMGYDVGLVDMNKNLGSSKLRLRNQNCYLSVGYKF